MKSLMNLFIYADGSLSLISLNIGKLWNLGATYKSLENIISNPISWTKELMDIGMDVDSFLHFIGRKGGVDPFLS